MWFERFAIGFIAFVLGTLFGGSIIISGFKQYAEGSGYYTLGGKAYIVKPAPEINK